MPLPDASFPPRSRPQGFGLLELLLVTVVLGIVASIVAPYFVRARERAVVAVMEADAHALMEGLETYATLNEGRWPPSLAELESGSTYAPTRSVRYCAFVSVPTSPGRGPYVLAIAGHPDTTVKILILYPIWGSRTLEFDDGQRGC